MDARAIEIESKRNSRIITKAFPGHYATSHSHVNYYVDMTSIKSSHRMARNAAVELSRKYLTTTPIDTIICLVVFGVLYRPLAKYLQARDIIRR